MEPSDAKPLGRGALLALRIRSGLLITLLRLVLFLFDVIRWLFAPLVLVLQLLFMVPYAKRLKLPVTRNGFKQIAETKLPEEAWIHFEQMASVFGLIGFRRGRYVRLSGPMGNQTTYGMPLVHDGLRLGLGVNCSLVFDAAGRTVDTGHFVEMTSECQQGRMLDFTNSADLDPFLPANRTRVHLPELGELQLLHLFSVYGEHQGCTLSDATLAGLMNDPDTVMWEEFRDGIRAIAEQGYLVATADDEAMRTTWKGAVYAGLLVQWPLSVFVARQRELATDGLLAEAGVSRSDADRIDIGSFLDPLPLTDETFNDVDLLRQVTDALMHRFSAEVQLAAIGYYFDGSAATQLPESIDCTYVLRTKHSSRELLRRSELQLDIDPSNGGINWLTVDDAHYSVDEYDASVDANAAQPLSNATDALLSLHQVIELSEALVATHAGTQGQRNDTLLVVEENGRTLWHRRTLLMDGGTVEIDLDGISGEILRHEHLR